jgi:hypothetical protein
MPSTPKSLSTRTASDFMQVSNLSGTEAATAVLAASRLQPVRVRLIARPTGNEQRRDPMTAKAEQKTFAVPDESREFERGTLDLIRIGGADIGRLTPQPGWR